MGDLSYQAAAVEFDEDGMFAGLEMFGNQDSDIDALVVGFLIRRAVDVEAVEARLWRCIVKRCHGSIVYCCWLVMVEVASDK